MIAGEAGFGRRWRAAAGLILLGLSVGLAAARCRASPTALIAGLPAALRSLEPFLHPDWSALPTMLVQAVVTVAISLLATPFAAMAAVLLALAAARNLAPPWLRPTVRAALGFERALPDVFVLLALVAALGLGPAPAVLAIGFSSLGMLGKLYADAFEEVDERLLDSLRSTGAGYWQIVRFAVLPAVAPQLVSGAVLRFEINVRAATLLGAVSGLGVGHELLKSLGYVEYGKATVAVIVIGALVLLCEQASARLRRKLLADPRGLTLGSINQLAPSYGTTRLRRRATGLLIGSALLTAAAVWLELNPFELIREFEHVVDLADRAWPPNLPLLWRRPAVYLLLGETLAVAWLGSVVGGSIALTLALLAADNSTPLPTVRRVVRTLLAFERAVPPFVTLLLVQVAVGFGAFSSALAVAMGTIGTFGKMFADSLENVERGPAESLTAIGAGRRQCVRFAILPAALPAIAANWLYACDVNLRHAVALGVVGGGGLGYEFYLAQKLLRHDDMLALALLIALLVMIVETLSDRLRSRILDATRLR